MDILVDFDEDKCCPVLVLDHNHFIMHHFKSYFCFPDQVHSLTVWFPSNNYVLDPGKNNQKYFVCRKKDFGRYSCLIPVKAQWYARKPMDLAIGFLCDQIDKQKSLLNVRVEVNIKKESNYTICSPIQKEVSSLRCEQFYDYVTFPNMFGHLTQADASQALEVFTALIQNLKVPCYQHMIYTLCQAFFPQCPERREIGISQDGAISGTMDSYFVDHLVALCSEMCDDIYVSCYDELQQVMQHVTCVYYDSIHDSDICVYKNVTSSTIPNITNSKSIPNRHISYLGDSLDIICEDGFEIQGNSTITCDYSGLFLNPPVCRPIKKPLDIWIVIGPVSASVFFLIFWIILLFCWKCRSRHDTVSELLKRKRPKDTFVSYCADGQDKEYVQNELYPELELKADPPLKLLIHERDFRADTLIYVNIMNAIRDSNAAIIIMSQDYINADWCRQEFEECVEEAKKDPAFKLYVILTQPEEIPNWLCFSTCQF